jgi:DNA-binding NarL/FixJ family response regulator
VPEPRGSSTARLATSVLIVDDNTALISALALRLAMHGEFECFPALQVLRDPVEHIAALHPAIVLLDLNLPGTERSIDVIRALRSRTPDIRVIVLTGNPSPQAIRDAREAGAVGFVAKGVHPDRLLTVMRQASADEFMLELDG